MGMHHMNHVFMLHSVRDVGALKSCGKVVSQLAKAHHTSDSGVDFDASVLILKQPAA